MKPWTTTELRVIRENFHRPDHEIAALLPGRSLSSTKIARLKYVGAKPGGRWGSERRSEVCQLGAQRPAPRPRPSGTRGERIAALEATCAELLDRVQFLEAQLRREVAA